MRVVQSWRLTGNRCASPQATELRSFTHDMWWEVQGCFLKPPNYAGAQPPSNLGIYACTEGCFLPCRVSNWLGARVSPQSCLCHVLTTCAEKHSKLLQAVMTMPLAFSFFFFFNIQWQCFYSDGFSAPLFLFWESFRNSTRKYGKVVFNDMS